MDKSAQHSQPSNCQQAHMMACSRQGKRHASNTVKLCFCARGVFPIMPSSRRSLRPRECFPVSFVRRCWSGKLLTLCFLIDWPSLLCATHKRFRWSNPNAQKKTCAQSCAVYCPLLINRFLSTKWIWCLLTGETLFIQLGGGMVGAVGWALSKKCWLD